jgi:DNA polymerase III gamma/tau subunit
MVLVCFAAQKAEQQRLQQALKVLAESEKQLHVSNDRSTWLTAALLQFAPDQSYLPSSVDTSMSPSPIAFDTPEKITAAEAYTPKIRVSGNQILDHQNPKIHMWCLHPNCQLLLSSKERKRQSPKLASIIQRARKGCCLQSTNQKPKCNPAGSPTDKSQKSPLVATTRTCPTVIFDGTQIAESHDFQVLACKELENLWIKVLQGCWSNVLRQLFQAHGTLISLCIAKGEQQSSLVGGKSPLHHACILFTN